MNEVIALRINEDFLKKIDELSEHELSDRSTPLETLYKKDFKNILKKKQLKNT